MGPKVNVWLKKSDNSAQASQQQSAQENSSQDENSDQVTQASSDAVKKVSGSKPVEGSKSTAKIEPTSPNSAAIMKESTADNRPPPTAASNPVTTQTAKVNVPSKTQPSKTAKSNG